MYHDAEFPLLRKGRLDLKDGSKLARSNPGWMSGRMPVSVGIATFRRAGMRSLKIVVLIFVVVEISPNYFLTVLSRTVISSE